MPVLKTTPKGQVVIPKQFRKKFGIKPGAKVLVIEHEDGILIKPTPDDPIEAFCGFLKGGPSLTEALLEERRREREREDRECS